MALPLPGAFYQFCTRPAPILGNSGLRWPGKVATRPSTGQQVEKAGVMRMMSKSVWLCALSAGMLSSVAFSAEVDATPGNATSTTLVQSVLSPINLKAHGVTLAGRPWRFDLRTHAPTDGYVVDNVFAPGQTTGWHSHPGPSLIFVKSGSVTNYDSSAPHCKGRTYPAGSSFIDQGGSDVHMLRNNGSEPAETIAVQFIPSGQLRRVDQPEPATCNV
jgi:quercetin dioxygenase-like cupin family protein